MRMEELMPRRRKKRADMMTKAAFIEHWMEFGLPPDDAYFRNSAVVKLPECTPVGAELRTEEMAEKMWRRRQEWKIIAEAAFRPTFLARCLFEINSWRRGDGKYSEAGVPPPFSPYCVGKLFDCAVNCILGRRGQIVL